MKANNTITETRVKAYTNREMDTIGYELKAKGFNRSSL